MGMQAVELHTTGRKSGQRRSVLLTAPIAGRIAPRSTPSEARAETRVLFGQLTSPNARLLARGIDVTPMTVLGDPGLSASVARTRMIAMAATAIVLSAAP